jgi:hypothetical protein
MGRLDQLYVRVAVMSWQARAMDLGLATESQGIIDHLFRVSKSMEMALRSRPGSARDLLPKAFLAPLVPNALGANDGCDVSDSLICGGNF